MWWVAWAGGWMAAQVSMVSPWRVMLRQPPPRVSDCSKTVVRKPARASTMAALSPLGPEPMIKARGVGTGLRIRAKRVRLRPPEGSFDGFVPPRVQLVALRWWHGRLVGVLFAPEPTDVIGGGPDASGESGCVGGPEGGDFGDGGHDYGHPKLIGLELHE